MRRFLAVAAIAAVPLLIDTSTAQAAYCGALRSRCCQPSCCCECTCQQKCCTVMKTVREVTYEPYEVTAHKIVYKEVIDKVPIEAVKYVEETHYKMRCCTIMQAREVKCCPPCACGPTDCCGPKTCTQMVPVCCMKKVPYTAVRMVNYTKIEERPRVVIEKVPYKVTCYKPIVTCKQVPVKVCCPSCCCTPKCCCGN